MQPMIDAVNSYNSIPFIVNQKILQARDYYRSYTVIISFQIRN